MLNIPIESEHQGIIRSNGSFKKTKGRSLTMEDSPIGSTGRPSRRRALAGIGAAILAPGLARAQPRPRDLVIPISSYSFATASARAAEALGCFTRHGLNVKLTVVDVGSTLTSALVSGAVQMILGGPGELVVAQARGQPVVDLTNTYWGMSASLILSKEVADRTGVAASAPVPDRLKAVDGLLVAAPSATSSYTASFKGAAEAYGAKMRLTYMAQPAMVAALESGAVQGYIAGAPLWGAQVARAKAVLWVSGPKGELPPANTPASVTGFNAMRPFAEQNPDVVRQVIDSYRDFSAILDTAPDKVRAAFGKLYPDVDPATMDLLFEAEHRAFRMRDVTVADMQREIDFMRASGVPGLEKLQAASLLYVPPT
jgi:ABC-type nitrate/sulfonate/bicarbonate transport system substrate-binding protein